MTVHQNQLNRTLLLTRVLVLFSLLAFLILPTSVFAITCGCWMDLDLEYRDSDAVFMGTAVKIEDDKGFGFANFNVEKSWKNLHIGSPQF